MTAQEWLDELERLRKAATPGPWSKSEQGTNETYHHRIERYYGGKEVPEHIAYVFLPNVFWQLTRRSLHRCCVQRRADAGGDAQDCCESY